MKCNIRWVSVCEGDFIDRNESAGLGLLTSNTWREGKGEEVQYLYFYVLCYKKSRKCI